MSVCGAYGEYYCQRSNINLKSKRAKAAADCMLANTDMSCGPPPTCMRDSLEEACPDASADAACADYVTRCSPAVPLTDLECHGMVDGLNATGRASLQTCVNANNCQYGLWSCFEGL